MKARNRPAPCASAVLRATLCAACGDQKPSGHAFCRACLVRLWSIAAARALPAGLPLRIYAAPSAPIAAAAHREAFAADYAAALHYLKQSQQPDQPDLFGGAK